MSHSPIEMNDLLAEAGVLEISEYCKRLESQMHNREAYNDLLAEGYSALTMARSSFRVTMRDRPDLKLELGSNTVGAEVKRFRRKLQDGVDERRMEQADDFTQYGNTSVSEGQHAWEQVVDVLDKKCSQLWAGKPNVLVILSFSPNCIEDAEVMFAVKKISKRQARGASKDRDLERLNGAVFLSLEYNVTMRRNIYFFECEHPSVPLPDEVRQLLLGITNWDNGLTTA